MARDADALKIQKWAATGDVQDPEDGGLLRSTGWDATYSQPGGNLPKREHINQLFRELSAQGVEVKVHGAGLEWDSSISYEHPAMVMGSDARPYVSVQNSAGADPTSDIINSHWALLESQGPAGRAGPPGTAGSDGSNATALQFDIAANREAAGNKGVLFFATDTFLLSYDDGAAYVDVGHVVEFTTKGDLIVFDGTKPVRLAVGANDTIPIADSGEASGVKWATNPAKISEEFTSAEQTITSAGTLTIAHSLGAMPKLVQARLICKTASLNYSVNDEVIVDFVQSYNSTEEDHGLQVVADSTNLVLRFGASSACMSLLNKTTGVKANVNNVDWRLILRAYA